MITEHEKEFLLKPATKADLFMIAELIIRECSNHPTSGMDNLFEVASFAWKVPNTALTMVADIVERE